MSVSSPPPEEGNGRKLGGGEINEEGDKTFQVYTSKCRQKNLLQIWEVFNILPRKVKDSAGYLPRMFPFGDGFSLLC